MVGDDDIAGLMIYNARFCRSANPLSGLCLPSTKHYQIKC